MRSGTYGHGTGTLFIHRSSDQLTVSTLLPEPAKPARINLDDCKQKCLLNIMQGSKAKRHAIGKVIVHSFGEAGPTSVGGT